MSYNNRIINTPELFRNNIINYFKKILIQDDKICKNIEIAIYNYSIQESIKKHIIKKWDNYAFVNIYLQKLKIIIFNIQNENLKKKIINKELKPKEFIFMNHQELRPDIWNELIEKKKNYR